MSDRTPAIPEAAISEAEVRHIASLANLELTADELPRMARDLSQVLGYIAQLSELDTSTLEPMAQVAEVLGRSQAQHGETLRADRLRPSVDRTSVLAEAPEADARFFKVPKVIER